MKNQYIVQDVTTPFKTDKEQNSTLVQIYKNYWWCCVDGDSTKAIFYGPFKTPQCNMNKSIMEHRHPSGTTCERISKALGVNVELVQIPMAYFTRPNY